MSDSSTERVLAVDATHGTRVKVGDVVEPGHVLGRAIGSEEPVLAPFRAVVEGIGFNPEEHSLEIRLRATGEAAPKSVSE